MYGEPCKFDRGELEKRLKDSSIDEWIIRDVLEQYPEDYRCRRPKYPGGDGFCIFHTETKPDEFPELFWEELDGMREEAYFDFSGFVFPEMTFLREGRPLSLDKKVLFTGARFRGMADLSYAELGEASFIGAEFEEARFVNARFKGRVDFRHASFKEANFRGTEFEKVDFSKAEFGVADFTEAKFGEVNFIEAEFGAAYFFDAEFGIADFRSSEFMIADFMGAEFMIADFAESEFDVADFRSVEFDVADFTGANFMVADFRGANFGTADFTKCVFKEIALFLRTTFEGNATFVAPNGEAGGPIVFATAKFNRPCCVLISGFPLSRLSFLLTDLTGVNLIPKRSGKLELLDERLLFELRLKPPERRVRELLEGLGLLSPETLAIEVRGLRKNLEAGSFYEEAGELFVREMRLRRKLIRKRSIWRYLPEYLVNCFYDLLGYGESIARPFLGMLLTVILSAILMTLGGGFSQDFLREVLKNIIIVTSVFLQMRSFRDFALNIPAPELTAAEVMIRSLSVVLFATLFIALRRKLERK